MKFGLSYPVIAKWTGTKSYANGFVCGQAINTEVTPSYAEGTVYGDNKLVKNRRKFRNAAVTMGTTVLPLAADNVMFGHTLDEEGKVTYKVQDENTYVGYGFISREERDGKDVHVACVLHKVMFSEGANSYETEGENITFNTPSVTGTAIGDDTGEWRTTKPFDTEDEAMAWIKGFLCLEEKCVTPVASVAAGTYDGAQTVTLSVSDGGAIYYTTNGTTPSKTNGTKATTSAITISQTTMLRAINTASGKADSDVLSVEYIITA